MGLQVGDDDMDAFKSMYGPDQGYSGKFKDDLTGQLFKDELVAQARAVELTYFQSKVVWRKVFRLGARATYGKSHITL